jgi:hypothetical protein
VSRDPVNILSNDGENGIYYLSDHVHLTSFQHGAILLDLRTEDYVGISAEYIPALKRAIRNWPDSIFSQSQSVAGDPPDSLTVIEQLLSRQILTTCKMPARRGLTLEQRTAFSSERTRRPNPVARVKSIAHLLLALLKTLSRRRGHLRQDLALLERAMLTTQHSRARPVSTDIPRALEAFFSLRIWLYTASRHCLFDSMVLSDYLIRQGISCSLVIAVCVKPFLAHAWVQIGTMVVNDTVEHVQTFAPILVIGPVSEEK